jgi:hypothetical protein
MELPLSSRHQPRCRDYEAKNGGWVFNHDHLKPSEFPKFLEIQDIVKIASNGIFVPFVEWNKPESGNE